MKPLATLEAVKYKDKSSTREKNTKRNKVFRAEIMGKIQHRVENPHKGLNGLIVCLQQDLN